METGEELRANTLSRDYYDHVIDACPEMVFILNAVGVITETNQTVCTYLGYDKGTLSGIGLAALSDHPMSRFWLHVPDTGQLELSLHRLRTATGSWFPVQLRASFLPEGRGKKREIVVIGKLLRLDVLVETLRQALQASVDTQEQSILRECLLLCTQPIDRTQAVPLKIRLTRRERAILPLVAQGLTSGEIGKTLGILEPTVNKHRENLRKKFGVHNTVDLVLAAKRGKFIK